LAAAAGVCLALGWLLEQIVLVDVALGASGLGLVLVVVQVWRRRRLSQKDKPAAPDEVDEPEEQPDEIPEPDAAVYVVSGRKRFHRRDCRLLDGRDAEELTLLEAQEEDFTPCTVCAATEAEEELASQS
jgi:hypothetical protein